MTDRRMVLTPAEVRRLTRMLASEFAVAIGPSDHLEELRAEVQRAEVVSPERVPGDVMGMNAIAILRDLETGEVEMFELVYPDKADIAARRLSVLAPVGTNLLGCRVGDILSWRVGSGARRLRLEAVEAAARHAPPEPEVVPADL